MLAQFVLFRNAILQVLKDIAINSADSTDSEVAISPRFHIID